MVNSLPRAWTRQVVAISLIATLVGPIARGQTLPSPDPPPPESVSSEQLLKRLQATEEMNRQLLQRVEQLSKQLEDVSRKVDDSARPQESTPRQEPEKAAEPGKEPEPKKEPEDSGLAGPGGFKPPPDERGSLSRSTIEGGGARSSPNRLLPFDQEAGNRFLGRVPLKGFYDYDRDGVGLATEDNEFLLKFRTEFQADSLLLLRPSNQSPTHSGFYLPRTRYYFQGHFTKPIDYQLSFQRSYTTFGFLNVFMNFNLDPRFQFRVGRFKPPFTYEWFKLNNWRLITPERSLFALNFGLSRMVGGMLWGEFFDERLDYAVGIFDGPRNSEQDTNNAKDVVALINTRPFHGMPESPLRNLSFGGSVDSGVQNNSMTGAWRTNVNFSNQSITSTDPIANATIPFLQFNPGVFERGPRNLWEMHLAYFFNGLSLIGAWDMGYESYALGNTPPVQVPISGYFVEAAYLLTGEVINERTNVDPIRRFDLRPSKFGLGAFEPFARYSYLDVGDEIFTGGFADSNIWTNRLGLIDLGLNWYVNKGVKVYFDWQHAMFARAVNYPAGPSKVNDNFWLRFQFYY